MNDGIERKILQQIAEKLIMKKEEMFFLADGQEKALDVVNAAVKNLLNTGMIAVTPVGESTFAVTQKGMREARKV